MLHKDHLNLPSSVVYFAMSPSEIGVQRLNQQIKSIDGLASASSTILREVKFSFENVYEF